MQFIPNGPDIPEGLLQAHEEGRVVFFCGAGISYPAGLPGFRGLVDSLYERVGTTRSLIENDAYAKSKFDAVLDLLERRLPGQRTAVRRELIGALEPKWRRKGATTTHEALLDLARSVDGSLRIVTTNFDRIFERVGKRSKYTFRSHSAPMLPIPKNSRWNGLVYLHGLLPSTPDDSELRRLVLTSGDFGLAYLTERWAARFVSELFRNYVVCFVGYSIDDPVLRYMMDALAADRLLGEFLPQAYALGDYQPGAEDAKQIEWIAKGVVPILYEVPTSSNDHSALHKTLKQWAETYRDGVLGRERIVVDYALARPSATTKQDDFVGRVLWALSHQSGLPAKRFAEFDPAPSLDWLHVLSESRFRHDDLIRFGVAPRQEQDKTLKFSFITRPAPYEKSAWMTLFHEASERARWDEPMFQIARWLLRHLGDPDLILWLAERGGVHHRWAWLIAAKLDELERLRKDHDDTAIATIVANAENAVPSPLLETAWRLLLAGRVKTRQHSGDLYQWVGRLKDAGLTRTLKFELRDLLKPKIRLKKPYIWRIDEEKEDGGRSVRTISWELELASEHVRTAIQETSGEVWQNIIGELTGELDQLLCDALDLAREMGESDSYSDRSYWDMPSISPHWQNRGYRDWTILIELVRDAWLSMRAKGPERAKQIAKQWFDRPYPTWKRLALFAAANGAIDGDLWVDWLLSDETRWLWSVETQRETMRLLVKQGAALSPMDAMRLQTAIVVGPPRSIFRDDIEPERINAAADRMVWLRLAKLELGGMPLGDVGEATRATISEANPQWKLAPNEQDEFSHWMSGTGDPGDGEESHIEDAPRKRLQLIQWLDKPHREWDPEHEDNWSAVCRERFFHSIGALCDLGKRGIWPASRWREAFQAWSNSESLRRSWKFVLPVLAEMPDRVLLEIVHSLTWWIRQTVKEGMVEKRASILYLADRILNLTFTEDGDEPENNDSQLLNRAINHPVGQIVEVLLDIWFQTKPSDGDLLPGDLEPVFTEICDNSNSVYRLGRVLLASRLISLYRVDRVWTEKHLLPLFEWRRSTIEAKAVWEGFLWSPRIYWPLLIAFKDEFLLTASHYSELGDNARQYVALLTYVSLEPPDGFSVSDLRAAVGSLPKQGLEAAAKVLSQALESAGSQSSDYWQNRVQPFWRKVWPKSADLQSQAISEALALACVAAEAAFPSAFEVLRGWLGPIEHPHYVVHKLHQSNLSELYPEQTLAFLDLIIEDQSWAPAELRQCLDAIAQSGKDLLSDRRYQRLSEYVRKNAR